MVKCPVLLHIAALTACLAVLAGPAAADAVDRNTARLATGSTYRVRLTAALALSKSKDGRAVHALASALGNDRQPAIRRVSALALAKMVDNRTPADARDFALDALDRAIAADDAPKVRDTAKKALRALSGLRRIAKRTPRGARLGVFVTIDATTDQSRRAPSGARERVTKVVKKGIERTGYSTSWPGGVPTSAQLTTARSRAFIVASTVKHIRTSSNGPQTQIACTVAIRVAPWSGTDGGEKWEASRAASASGSATAVTGNTDREIAGGVTECLETVSADVTARQVLPFLDRLATTTM